MRARDKHSETAIESVDSDPRFVRATRVSAAGDNGGLDAFAAVTGDALDSEDRERHKAALYGVMVVVGSSGVKDH